MNTQEAFDTALNHIRAQGAPAIKPGSTRCQYRTETGLQCAAAPFIRDYTPDMDNWEISGGASWLAISDTYRDRLVDGIDEDVRHFIQHLQDAHDEAADEARIEEADFMDLYEDAMHTLALDYGLVYDAP